MTCNIIILSSNSYADRD